MVRTQGFHPGNRGEDWLRRELFSFINNSRLGVSELLHLRPIRKAGRMSRAACEHDSGGGVDRRISNLDGWPIPRNRTAHNLKQQQRPYRLMVRTPGFHPGNRGSIPRRVTAYILSKRHQSVLFTFEYSCDPKQATWVACGGESKTRSICLLANIRAAVQKS